MPIGSQLEQYRVIRKRSCFMTALIHGCKSTLGCASVRLVRRAQGVSPSLLQVVPHRVRIGGVRRGTSVPTPEH